MLNVPRRKEKKKKKRGLLGTGRRGGMEVETEGDYIDTCRYIVTTRMASSLRWAAMRAILMFHNCEGQSHKTVYTDHNFWTERRATEIQLTSIILSLPRLKPTANQHFYYSLEWNANHLHVILYLTFIFL